MLGQLYSQNNALSSDTNSGWKVCMCAQAVLSISDLGHNLVKVTGASSYHLMNGITDFTIAFNSLYKVPSQRVRRPLLK